MTVELVPVRKLSYFDQLVLDALRYRKSENVHGLSSFEISEYLSKRLRWPFLTLARLYPSLYKLENAGLISYYRDPEPTDVHGGHRYYYTLTEEGRRHV